MSGDPTQASHQKIPERAAQWFVAQMTQNEKNRANLLGPRAGKPTASTPEKMVQSLSHHILGISNLRLSELKDMCRLLDSSCNNFLHTIPNPHVDKTEMLHAVQNSLARYLYSPKADIIEKLMHALYCDYPICRAPRQEFIDLLVADVQPGRSGQSNQPATATAALPPPTGNAGGNSANIPLAPTAKPPPSNNATKQLITNMAAAASAASAPPTMQRKVPATSATAARLANLLTNGHSHARNGTLKTTPPTHGAASSTATQRVVAPWNTPNRTDAPSQSAAAVPSLFNQRTASSQTFTPVPPTNAAAAYAQALHPTAGAPAMAPPGSATAAASHPSWKKQRLAGSHRPVPMKTPGHETIHLDGVSDEDRMEDVPQNAEELNTVKTLQQMSFTDPKEILASFRKLRRAHPENLPPSVDDVMVDIITAREEAEEARRMDAARLLSEQSRKEESKRRRDGMEREFRTSLELCANVQWLMNPQDKRLYQASWILNDATIFAALQKRITSQVTTLKLQLLQLLKFEKNAQKWYGSVLPKSYFRYVINKRLVQSIVLDGNDRDGQHLLLQMQKENQLLETGMYDLSEQMGGVPKLFRDAHDQYQLHVQSKEEVNLLSTNASPVVIDLLDD